MRWRRSLYTVMLVNPSHRTALYASSCFRADYARVLAEFWADGIDSETPPGHWFEIYHYVTDQPTFEWKWKGLGPQLDELEYDVKAHLALVEPCMMQPLVHGVKRVLRLHSTCIIYSIYGRKRPKFRYVLPQL